MSQRPMPSLPASPHRHWLGERTAEALRLIDQGLLLYRRHFLSFLLPPLILLLPLGMLTILAVSIEGWLLLLLALLLWVPLPFMFLHALSRVTLDLVQHQPITVWRSVWVNPLRILSMLVYSVFFQIVAQIVSNTVLLLCICPAFSTFAALLGIGAGTGNDLISTIATVAGGVVSIVGLLFIYAVSIVISGMTISSTVYALQPFVQRTFDLGTAISDSIELIRYRIGYNLLVWAIAAVLFGALMLIVTLAIGVLIPLPLTFALGEESPLTQAISAGAVLCGLLVALPPLPIWMALLYHQHQQARTATDLEQRIAAWQPSATSAEGPPPQG